MKYFYGDIIKAKLGKEDCSVCITTNGFRKKNGEAVMGRGIAKQIKTLFLSKPARINIAEYLGIAIARNGNIVQKVAMYPTGTFCVNDIVSFPVKPVAMVCMTGDEMVKHMRPVFKRNDVIPGWACKASLDIIQQSAEQLVELIKANKIKTPVYLPRPGAGAGELGWEEVRQTISPILESVEDLYICDFKKTDNDI